jgi:glycosyltransferase
MRISIITVCYNSATTIADTFRSVASQHYTKLEHIIIDGGSTDGTLQLIEEYATSQAVGRVKWLSEKDQGLYDAMNKGLIGCSGEVVGFLNADDFLAYPDAIADLAAIFNSKKPDCVYADLNYVAFDDSLKIVRKWRSGPYRKQSFLWGWMPPHPTFYAKTELYKKYGDYRLDLKSAADYELMLRFLCKYQATAAYLPQTLVHMRTGGISNASLKNRLLANQMDRKAWEINGLRPNFFTLFLKPLRKISQFAIIKREN